MLEPSLEDAYLAVLGSQRNNAAAAGAPRSVGVVA
jgi:hypothetical protein